MQRTIPFYVDTIVPDSIAQGKNVLIASSENAIRGLLMHLCEVREKKSLTNPIFRNEFPMEIHFWVLIGVMNYFIYHRVSTIFIARI